MLIVGYCMTILSERRLSEAPFNDLRFEPSSERGCNTAHRRVRAGQEIRSEPGSAKIARFVCFAASEEASFTTGATLAVNGGNSAG